MTKEALQAIRDAESKVKSIITEAKQNADKQIELAKQNAEKMISEAKAKETKLYDEERNKSKLDVEKNTEFIQQTTEKEKQSILDRYNSKKDQAVNSLVKSVLE